MTDLIEHNPDTKTIKHGYSTVAMGIGEKISKMISDNLSDTFSSTTEEVARATVCSLAGTAILGGCLILMFGPYALANTIGNSNPNTAAVTLISGTPLGFAIAWHILGKEHGYAGAAAVLGPMALIPVSAATAFLGTKDIVLKTLELSTKYTVKGIRAIGEHLNTSPIISLGL